MEHFGCIQEGTEYTFTDINVRIRVNYANFNKMVSQCTTTITASNGYHNQSSYDMDTNSQSIFYVNFQMPVGGMVNIEMEGK